ncbi:MAG TPA: nucleotide exchange factor GrpE [Candidatus Paceibacterota bacterium]|nr:nucleotide exchange factor GrpE [Candidatus Paceibacterota bacterium]
MKNDKEIENENNEYFKDEDNIEESLHTPDSENIDDLSYIESTEDGEELPTKDTVKKLREELKTCHKEKEEYLTGWQRAKADYINLQKELTSTRENVSILTKEKIVEKLLPAFDSFEMAFANKEHWDKLDKEWQDGIKSIHKQFLSGLSNIGIEEISESGVPFDPSIHQSVSAIPTDDESKDHIIEKVFQVGYKIGDRVIRPAKVTIYTYKKD